MYLLILCSFTSNQSRRFMYFMQGIYLFLFLICTSEEIELLSYPSKVLLKIENHFLKQ